MSLSDQGAGMFSRQKIIKQLAYTGVVYIKKKIKRKQVYCANLTVSSVSNKKTNDDFINDSNEEKSLHALSDINDSFENFLRETKNSDDVDVHKDSIGDATVEKSVGSKNS